MTQHTDLIFYSSPDGHVKIEVICIEELLRKAKR